MSVVIKNLDPQVGPPSKMLEALQYAQLGWPVLPLHFITKDGCSCKNGQCSSPAKHPLTAKGSLDASKEPATICQWWDKFPEANIGIATGTRANLIVVDVDPRHGGGKAWDDWTLLNEIPKTLKVHTGGGGFHLYFESHHPDLRNRTNILPGVDIRGDGGYVIAPSSIHNSGKSYLWETPPIDSNIQPLPSTLLHLLQRDKTQPSSSSAASKKVIQSGQRNSTLTSIAGFLRKSNFDETGINHTLNAINSSLCEPPLDEKEVGQISKSIAKYNPGKSRDLKWLPPLKLPEYNIKTIPLTENYIPEALKSWTIDIADRMQIPLDFVAAPAIVCLSSVIGRQIGIYPKQDDDWLVVPNLWGAVIARPGFFKSPAISEATRPLEILAKQARIKYEAAAVVENARQDILKAKIDGLKELVRKAARKGNIHNIDDYKHDLEEVYKELETIGITEKRFKTNDATVEKLACLLNENPNGMLVLRDELSGWLNSMNKSGREGDRDFYLESWNGYGSYSVDRIGRGTIHVGSLCLSIFGGLQPGKLDAYVSHALAGGKGDDGLLQRFQILVYPETPKKWKNIDRRPKTEAFDSVVKVFKRLTDIPIQANNISNQTHGIRFNLDAQAEFDLWREKLETRLRGNQLGSQAFESHLAKYRSLVPSLALIFHSLNMASKGLDISSSKIDLESLLLAIKWSEFLESHAHKIYAKATNPEINSATFLAEKIKANIVRDQDSMRTIYRHGWAPLNTTEKLDAAISVLEDCNWVQVESLKSGSKMVEKIRINPSLSQSGLL